MKSSLAHDAHEKNILYHHYVSVCWMAVHVQRFPCHVKAHRVSVITLTGRPIPFYLRWSTPVRWRKHMVSGKCRGCTATDPCKPRRHRDGETSPQSKMDHVLFYNTSKQHQHCFINDKRLNLMMHTWWQRVDRVNVTTWNNNWWRCKMMFIDAQHSYADSEYKDSTIQLQSVELCSSIR